MAEFQTASAGIGLAKDVTQLVKYLRRVKKAMDTVEDDIDEMINELESLTSLYGQLEESYKRQAKDDTLDTRQRQLWFDLRDILNDGKDNVKKFDEQLKAIYGDNPEVLDKWDAFKMQRKLRSNTPRLDALRKQLHTYNGVLQLWLQQITLTHQDKTREFERTTTSEISEMKNTINDLMYQLQQSPLLTGEFEDSPAFKMASIAALNKATERLKYNQYFSTPSPVDSNYVGREDQSKQLAEHLFASQSQLQQQRFVIYGVGGSGKTQFCCKFAEDYRERFWGVFWIDGRSHSDLMQSLVQNVAKVAEVDPTHGAALYWLANQQERWLLIIDNADAPDIDLMSFIPVGGRGNILITTRNPAYRALGSSESCSFEFEGLEQEEANALLLRTAGISTSPSLDKSDDPTSLATKIVNALGRLALAIAVAGRFIRTEVCNLKNYLQFHQDRLMRLWRTRNLIEASDKFDEKRAATVEATFDISYAALVKRDTAESRDAIEILKTFAYLHPENIRYAFLTTCIENAKQEKETERQEKERAATEPAAAKASVSLPPVTWSEWMSQCWIKLWIALQGIRGQEVLPHFLIEGKRKLSLDYWRFQRAMSQLRQYSLVVHHKASESADDSWSMHPLIHQWAQKMIHEKVGEQYTWCESAANLLSNCVYIHKPNQELMRELLPHVEQVRREQKRIEEDIKQMRVDRIKPIPIIEPNADQRRILMLAKFSIVYSSNGRWKEAAELQRIVQRFLIQVRGFGNQYTRRITRALAETLWHLGRSNDSAKQHEALVEGCIKYCGTNDRETLVAIYGLGDSRWLQGRIFEARRLFRDALAGLEKQFGKEDEDTLTAMDHLGKAILLYATEEAIAEAKSLHEFTVKVRLETLPANDLRTLYSRELLYMVATWSYDRQDLLKAKEGLNEIIEIRRKKLGREHAFTLLGILNLARVETALEDFDVAEELYEACIPIAERDYGKNHAAVMFAQFCKGRLRCRQQRWTEARDILADVTDRQTRSLQGWGQHHFDRLGGLLELIKAYDALDEHVKRDRTAAEALRIFEETTREAHPWAKKLRAQLDGWQNKTEAAFAQGKEDSLAYRFPTAPSGDPIESSPRLVHAITF